MEVVYYSPSALRSFYSNANFSVVRINIFGLHRTGARDIPSFGLEVVSGTNANSYTPHRLTGESENYEKATNWVYEIY